MDAKQEFAVRLYRWAILDSHEEMDAGFPLVSRLGNGNAKSYLAVMSRLDVDRRKLLLAAFVKRFHPEAIDILDDYITGEEEALLEWADELRLEMGCIFPPPLRLSSKKLRVLLKKELVERWGGQTQLKKMGPKIFSFESTLAPWVVRTWFDYGRRPEYFHHVDGDDATIAHLLSIESWMGISSTTDWTQGPANSEEEIAKTMVDAAQRFLDHAPALLEGLAPDE